MSFDTDRRQWGLRRAGLGVVVRALASRFGIHVFLIHRRPLGKSRPARALPKGHEIRYLTDADVDRVTADQELNLSAEFAREALRRGDVCIGCFDRGRLVSYFWSGFDVVPMQAGLWVRVPAGHAYAYKALTLNEYRGRHLQQLMLEANDHALSGRGLTHNLEYVQPHNFAQRAASARYGNRVIGFAGFVEWGRTVIPFRSRGVRARGFEIFVPHR